MVSAGQMDVALVLADGAGGKAFASDAAAFGLVANLIGGRFVAVAVDARWARWRDRRAIVLPVVSDGAVCGVDAWATMPRRS